MVTRLEFVDNIFSYIKRLSLRYSGFKFLGLLLSILFMASLLITASKVSALPTVPNLLTHTWTIYIFTYWTHHPLLLLFFSGAFFLIFGLNVMQAAFERRVPPLPPLTGDKLNEHVIRRLNQGLCVILIISTMIAIPLLHLWLPTWSNTFLVIISTAGTFISFLPSFFHDSGANLRRRLGNYDFHFHGRLSFDTASMGAEAVQVKRELSHYEEIRGASPLNNKVECYLSDGRHSTAWEGYKEFYQKLGQFVQVNASRITTHQNTTTAIEHALRLLASDGTYCVTTDIEYGSVLDRVKRSFPEGRLHLVQLKDEHLDGTLSSHEIVNRVVRAVNNLYASDDGKRRYVIVLSHVIYLTGVVLDISRLCSEISVPKARLFLVIDGAQAVGNIEVHRKLVDECDFYATSGHKWLLGKAALGILFHSPEVYEKLDISVADIRKNTPPFSSIDFEIDGNYASETTNIEPIVSLNVMLVELLEIGQHTLAEHNAALARVFAKYVPRISGAMLLTRETEGGIVSVRVQNAKSVEESLEERFGYHCQALDANTLRFSFHYFVSERDVYALVDALNDTIRSVRRSNSSWGRSLNSVA
jgi:selenocysteine lyase/cysteine desulfurase